MNPTYATPAGPHAATIPASARTHFYQLRVLSMSGVTGTVRLDGHDLWPFGGFDRSHLRERNLFAVGRW